MNATPGMAATLQEIMVRFDPAQRVAVVFLRNTIDASGSITIWKNGVIEQSTVEYYRVTLPMTGADEEVMRKRFADGNGIPVENVKINKRIPRTPKERQSLLSVNKPSLLQHSPIAPTAQPEPTPQSAVAEKLAQLSPEDLAAFLELLNVGKPSAPASSGLTLVHDADAAVPTPQPEQAPAMPQDAATETPISAPIAPPVESVHPADDAPKRAHRMTKKEKAAKRSDAAKRAAATRSANKARAIESQAMPSGPQGNLPQAGETPAPMPTAQSAIITATPEQIAEQVARIREQMNAQIDAVLQQLTPAGK